MLKYLTNGIIGNSLGVSEFSIYGTDTYENYQRLLQSQPDDWYYRTHNVTYNRNSLGHRSIEVEQLPDDYILFTGCSITVGSGVELEKTYPYLISKRLNQQYYNLAIEASGPDMLVYNLSLWLKHYKKPKMIVIQWPETTRTFRNTDKIIPLGSWALSKELPIDKHIVDNYKNIVMTDSLEHSMHIYKHMVSNMLDIKCVHIDWVDYLDKGRDNQHPGIISHQTVVDNFFNNIGQ
jgi:hypothetical protein